MIPEKAEECPKCGAELSQFGYDMQQCPCGWNAMLPPERWTAEERQEEGLRRSAENGMCSAAAVLMLLDRLVTCRAELSKLKRQHGEGS